VSETNDWEALCARVDAQPMQLAHEAVTCAAWPAVIRLAPNRWGEALLAGEDVPGLRLCRRLIIVGRRLSRDEVVRVASCPHLVDLEELRLFDVGLNDDIAEAFAEAASFTRLTALYAPWSQIGPRGARALIQAFPHLKLLHLYRNQLGPAGVAALTEHAPALESLNVCFNGLGPAGAEVVGQAIRLRSLRVLHLGLNDLGDDGFRALGRSPHLDSLEELNAKANGAHASGLDALLNGRPARALRRVLLEENHFGPEGAEVVAAAATRDITTLQFGGAEVGVTGARALARAPALAKLEALTVWSNRLGDEGLAALLEAPFIHTLSVLDVSDNGLSARGLAAVHALGTLKQVRARP
jgi:hypothetical protein